jgi:alkylation response protein AidB-like acyl-CoA dehydrogenase
MSTRLSPTETEIVQALAGILAKVAPLSDTLNAATSALGFDRDVQRTLAELGFFGVCSAASAGGLELSQRALGEFSLEAGRVLLGGPWLEQLLAVGLLGANHAGGQLLAEVIAGTTLASLPLTGSTWQRPPTVRIDGVDAHFGGGVVELGFASSVDTWLLPASHAEAGATLLVQVSPDSARCRSRRKWSEIWRSDDVELKGASGRVLGQLGLDMTSAHLLQTARLLASASVGSTEALLGSTTEFLKQREQFGRPLGSFQALQHMMADVFIDLEHTRSLVRASYDTFAGEEAETIVAMAKVAADRLAVGSAETALQAHGGLGFTWELPVHHFLKEALRRRTVPRPSALERQDLARLAISYRL